MDKKGLKGPKRRVEGKSTNGWTERGRKVLRQVEGNRRMDGQKGLEEPIWV